ncbi:MAG: PTS sugar transporter subunit IIA [Thioalkalivibrionaceae bacterium]
MHPVDLLAPGAVAIEIEIESKKRALERLAELLDCPPAAASTTTDENNSDAAPGPTAADFIVALSTREKLGSTGLGHGIAIPHGRVANLDEPRMALLRVPAGLDFEAIDNEPVDLLIALVVPENAPNEHLGILAQLARRVSKPEHRAKLRQTDTADDLRTAFIAMFSDASDAESR